MLGEVDGSSIRLYASIRAHWGPCQFKSGADSLPLLVHDQITDAEYEVRDSFEAVLHQRSVFVE